MCKHCKESSTLLAKLDRTMDPAKGNCHEVRIAANTYRGSWHVDIRMFFLDPDGVWYPTRRGAAIRSGEIDEVIDALLQAKARFANT